MTDVADASLEVFFKAVLGKKALKVVALDVRELTSIADVFIICSGRSSRQVSAIADHIVRELRKQKIKPLSVEGAADGQWVLIDYGYVVIHVFLEAARQLYDLEGLWSDARRIPVPAPARARSAAGRRPSAPGDDE
jgi:ribosome-associated protein